MLPLISRNAFLFLLGATIVGHSYACTQPPLVTDVYPSGDVLPENLLRFYVYFSSPMSPERALGGIYLKDKSGKRLEGTFLANKVDLWSPDRQRLTVLFDPGRVKNGLVAHNTLGRAIQVGHQYTLVVNQTLKSSKGCPLEMPHEKSFKVIEADFESPDLALWKVSTPRAASLDWLSIKLNGSHDHVSLAYRVRVINSKEQIVAGKIALGENDAEWRFKPLTNWEDDNYQIIVDISLEDIAGNRLTGTFERPINNSASVLTSLNFHPTLGD